jgi:hypothetical protein
MLNSPDTVQNEAGSGGIESRKSELLVRVESGRLG